MTNKKLWFLIAALLIIALYFLVKFGTSHGVVTIDPVTGEDNLTQLCNDKKFVMTYGEFFMCR